MTLITAAKETIESKVVFKPANVFSNLEKVAPEESNCFSKRTMGVLLNDVFVTKAVKEW